MTTGGGAAASDRTVILVDDGIATGATVRAALLALKRAGAARRVLPIPVAPSEVADALRRECDEAVILVEPPLFDSVSTFYEDFRQSKQAQKRDPLHHTRRMQERLRETVEHLRADVEKVDEPRLTSRGS